MNTETTYVGQDDVQSKETIDVLKGYGDVEYED